MMNIEVFHVVLLTKRICYFSRQGNQFPENVMDLYEFVFRDIEKIVLTSKAQMIR